MISTVLPVLWITSYSTNGYNNFYQITPLLSFHSSTSTNYLPSMVKVTLDVMCGMSIISVTKFGSFVVICLAVTILEKKKDAVLKKILPYFPADRMHVFYPPQTKHTIHIYMHKISRFLLQNYVKIIFNTVYGETYFWHL